MACKLQHASTKWFPLRANEKRREKEIEKKAAEMHKSQRGTVPMRNQFQELGEELQVGIPVSLTSANMCHSVCKNELPGDARYGGHTTPKGAFQWPIAWGSHATQKIL